MIPSLPPELRALIAKRLDDREIAIYARLFRDNRAVAQDCFSPPGKILRDAWALRRGNPSGLLLEKNQEKPEGLRLIDHFRPGLMDGSEGKRHEIFLTLKLFVELLADSVREEDLASRLSLQLPEGLQAASEMKFDYLVPQPVRAAVLRSPVPIKYFALTHPIVAQIIEPQGESLHPAFDLTAAYPIRLGVDINGWPVVQMNLATYTEDELHNPSPDPVYPVSLILHRPGHDIHTPWRRWSAQSLRFEDLDLQEGSVEMLQALLTTGVFRSFYRNEFTYVARYSVARLQHYTAGD